MASVKKLYSDNKNKNRKRTFLCARLIVLWATCGTVNFQTPSLFAFALSQASTSDTHRSAQDPLPPLEAIERDIANNKFEDTGSRLSAFLENHPDSWRAQYDLGYVEFRSHKIGSSIRELSRSLELNSQNAEAHKILGLDCSIIGRYDLAEVELLQAARLKPDSAEIHYFLARAYYMRGVYPLAKSEFETTLRLDPSYVKAYSNLGITMEALGNREESLKNYMMAIHLGEQQKQRSEWPYIYVGAFYNHQRNATEALNYARKGLEINPRSDAVYFEIGKAYRTRGEWQKAAQALRSAIAVNSQVPDYYYVLGLMLRQLGNHRESDAALAKYAQLKQPSRDADNELPEHNVLEPLNPPDLR